MQIPLDIYDTWKAVAEKYKSLHQGTDDQRREATKRGVSTIRARHGIDGLPWVCKTQHSNGWPSQSKDAIAFVEEGEAVTGRLARMEMFDMVNGTTRETNPYPIHSHNHEETPPNDEDYILVPQAFDWLGVNPGPPVDPPVPPEPPSDDLLARVAALEAWQVTAQAQIESAHRLALLANVRQFRAVGDPNGDAVDTNSRFAHSHQVRFRIEEIK